MSKLAGPDISHGRGGAGNFNPDDTQYADGEVVRVGVEGSHGDGVYSSGRGGKKKQPNLLCLQLPVLRNIARGDHATLQRS